MVGYLNWREGGGIQHHERGDAIENVFEKNIIEARYSWVVSRLKKHGVESVLDFGCGLGYGTNIIRAAGFNVIGIDKSKFAISRCRKRYPDVHFNVGNSPGCLRRNFDAIVACEVIEHVENASVLLMDCFSTLSDNGLLLLTTPNRRYSMQHNPHHIHVFSLEELEKLLPTGKVRGLASNILRGQRLLLCVMSPVNTQRLLLKLSNLPIIRHLKRYSSYFLVEVKR